METLDIRVLRSIPTPVADVLISRGCRNAADVLNKQQCVPEALQQLRVTDAKRKADMMLGACQREVAHRSQPLCSDAWGSADSALDLLKQAQMQRPIMLPCESLGALLGNALRPGGTLLEVCGLPGTGKTQFCMQLCAAAQIPRCPTFGGSNSLMDGLQEAVYIDAEGSFTPERYAQICRALLPEQNAGGSNTGLLETVLRRLHLCRTYDAAEMYATIKHLDSFLKTHRRVRVIVLDSIAFCFRHEFADNTVKRARVLTEIAATLRRYGSEYGIVVVLTNHMTTRFDKSSGDNGAGWLAPALGETWAHQPSTQVRFERQNAALGVVPLGRATLIKSMEQAVGRSCFFNINEMGIRDANSREV